MLMKKQHNERTNDLKRRIKPISSRFFILILVFHLLKRKVRLFLTKNMLINI